MRNIEDKLPKCVLDVAHGRGIPFCEVNWTALFAESVEDLNELQVRFLLLVQTVAFEEQIGLVVAVKRPMILIETPDRHSPAVVHFDGLHVEVLEGLFVHLGAVRLQPREQIRVQVRLVARLVTVTRRDDL